MFWWHDCFFAVTVTATFWLHLFVSINIIDGKWWGRMVRWKDIFFLCKSLFPIFHVQLGFDVAILSFGFPRTLRRDVFFSIVVTVQSSTNRWISSPRVLQYDRRGTFFLFRIGIVGSVNCHFLIGLLSGILVSTPVIIPSFELSRFSLSTIWTSLATFMGCSINQCGNWCFQDLVMLKARFV